MTGALDRTRCPERSRTVSQGIGLGTVFQTELGKSGGRCVPPVHVLSGGCGPVRARGRGI